MARPERRDADYFPFYCKEGRTLFILESKYQCKGTGFFTNVMRFLTMQPDHHICIHDEAERIYFFSRTKCDEESGIDMLSLMAKTGKIDADMWVSYQVIVSQDLLDSLGDAYKNRKNKIISLEELRVSYPKLAVSYPENPQAPVITSPNKPQRKGKERKGKKEITPFVLPDYIPLETWTAYLAVRVKKRAAQTEYALNLIIQELEKIKKEHGHDPLEVLKKSIKSGWVDVYPLKDGGNNGQGQKRFNTDTKDFRSTRQRELDAETERLTREYYAEKGITPP